MNRQTEYQRGRDDGLDLAKRIVEEGGLDALKEELRFRNVTGISTSLARKDLDKAAEGIKELIYQSMVVAWVSVLHDNFGFGQTRCERAMKAFSKLVDYMGNGWLYWNDLIKETKERLNLTIDVDALTVENLGKTYERPDPEDVYEEPDLVLPEAWQKILETLRFTERKGDDGTMEIFDEHGEPILNYENEFDKIGCYDILSGMVFAIDYWQIERPEPAMPEQLPAQVPKPKKRKKKKR